MFLSCACASFFLDVAGFGKCDLCQERTDDFVNQNGKQSDIADDSTIGAKLNINQSMLEGISNLSMGVLIPMGIGMAVCILLLSRAVGFAYKKQYSIISHGVLGVVAATAVMIRPYRVESFSAGITNVPFILGGAAISFGLSCVCNKLKANSHETSCSITFLHHDE